MNKSLSLLTVALMALSGCGVRRHPSAPPISSSPAPYEDSDGYIVLSQLLTGSGKDWHNTMIRISTFNYVHKSKTPYLLQDRFASDAKFLLVDHPVIDRSDLKHPPQTHKEIDQKIIGGAYFVSAVGFDASKTHAIVRVNYICGSLCGGGTYHLLVKDSDGWKEAPKKASCFWQY